MCDDFTQYRPAGRASPAVPFPKRLGDWGDGCRLFEPTSGELRAGRVRFRVRVPDATRVSALIEQRELALERTAGDERVWAAELDLREHAGARTQLRLGAILPNSRSKNTYSVLLIYSLE